MSFPPSSMFLDPTFFVSNMCDRLCDESVVQFLLVALAKVAAHLLLLDHTRRVKEYKSSWDSVGR